jgi:acyl-CoA reductase-like NAD-dependent aldehyde dehydrogenase
VLTGGKRDGAMFSATLLEDVPKDARVVTQEVFGPVAVLDRYTKFKDAVDRCKQASHR